MENQMSDLGDEIQSLREKTRENRREFLRVDVQTCFIAIDRARFEMSLGNSHEVRKEIAMTERGVEVIEHFLAEAPGELVEVQAKLAELKAALEALKRDFGRSSG
jgi:hypothetical protein